MTGFAGVSSAAQSSSSYTVHYGDTLWKIAALNQVGLSEIIKANPQISNPAMIYPGQVLNIPNLDSVKSFEAQVIQLTNTERAKQGLSPLHANWELSRMARYKSQDMMNKDYFDHNSPTYGSPFDMMKEFGISFSYAGENIAAGQTTPAQVVNGWMNSPGHRANILNPNYTQIGVGFAKGGSYGYYWTQEFISN
ncbi:MAG TPA: SafA/ExsA family spore coat assembly protein [Bacillota bacterium]|nr:SafA/ExsA family spore coat assembly protein [Bacillota bacterium]